MNLNNIIEQTEVLVYSLQDLALNRGEIMISFFFYVSQAHHYIITVFLSALFAFLFLEPSYLLTRYFDLPDSVHPSIR